MEGGLGAAVGASSSSLTSQLVSLNAKVDKLTTEVAALTKLLKPAAKKTKKPKRKH